MDKKACVYFHQGWTDIIMCFGLINYYASKYNEIEVIIRSDAKDLVNFYTKDLSNVKIIYIDTDNGRFYGNIVQGDVTTVNYINNTIIIPQNYEIMFHAEHDRFRTDKYKYYWYSNNPLNKQNRHFSEAFYTFYDIDYMTRINNFEFNRDLEIENNIYSKFINNYGTNYVIYHDDETNHLHGSHHVSTKLDLKIEDNISYVNLNKISTTFFDYIKVIKNAKEIHLIDSIWGTLLYQIDAKYGILEGKTVNLYCKRGHQNLFKFPLELPNWNLIL